MNGKCRTGKKAGNSGIALKKEAFSPCILSSRNQMIFP
jgi:hypothetical protein